MEIQAVAHCLLNPHTRVKGLGPLDFRPEPPLIQLPCPEALYLGLDRWAVTRNQLEVPEFKRFCRFADHALRRHDRDACIQRSEHKDCGRSRKSIAAEFLPPATDTREAESEESPHEHVTGMGVFMEELTRELERRGVAFECQESGNDKEI